MKNELLLYDEWKRKLDGITIFIIQNKYNKYCKNIKQKCKNILLTSEKVSWYI